MEQEMNAFEEEATTAQEETALTETKEQEPATLQDGEEAREGEAPTEAETQEEPSFQAEEKDYARMAEEDLAEIKRLDPSYLSLTHLSQLPFARRFASLRDLGLSVKEALAASNPRFPRENGKSHLRPSVDKGAASARGTLSGEEMRHAKELFSDLNDAEIQKLYRRVRSPYSY